MTRLLLGLGTRALSSHGHYSLHEQIQVAKKHNQHVQSFVLYDPHTSSIYKSNSATPKPHLLDPYQCKPDLLFISRGYCVLSTGQHPVSLAPLRYLLHQKMLHPRIPAWLLGSLTCFQHLQSLNWVACETIVHVDDFLHLLKSCPGLNQLTLKNVQIAYPESGAKADEVHTSSPVPRTGSPFLSTDTEGLYSGRRLRKLQLDLVVISDEGLERLLGLADTHRDLTARHSQMKKTTPLL